ncbi:MAG TPA: hypothetical protein ENJ95_00565 [Bacteroidetes bacterium]|nr:hypothetical protein [Bacteroidota bacterium]
MKFNALFFFLAVSTCVQAQYTYISDRRFFEPADLIGYKFLPGAMEIPNEAERDLEPGEYSFGVTANNLYIKGEGISGVYNINNMQPQDYGIKIFLMNARDARLQGHLKVIQNKWGMVESLIFKRSKNDREIIFYQVPATRELKSKEKSYFTDRGELAIAHTDSIWGTTIRPFLVMHRNENLQQRLHMSDSTYVTFIEEINIEKKEVKKKKKSRLAEGKKNKKSRKNEKAEMDNVDIELATSEEEEEKIESDTMATEAPKIKIKITKEYFVVLHSYITNRDGGQEYKIQKYPVKKINVREDETANLQEERFQWEFINDKKENIYLYLNGDKTVSRMEIGADNYLMRGF